MSISYYLTHPVSTKSITLDVDIQRRILEWQNKNKPLDWNTDLAAESTAGGQWYGDKAYEPANDWKIAVYSRLQELRDPDQEWLGDAEPPNEEAINKAERFYHALVESRFNPVNIRVAPSAAEGVGFIFWKSSRYAAIEFLNDGSIGLVLSPMDAKSEFYPVEPKESEFRRAIGDIKRFIG